jgi:hypothetical protein
MTWQSRRASDIKKRLGGWEEAELLFHDRIPVRHLTVFAGGPAKGKSTLGYHIAAEVDVPTIFITTEESDATVWGPRIESAGVDLSKAFHHPRVKFSKKPEDLEHLVELIDACNARLVIVDPISNHLRGASIHRDEQVREVFEPYLEVLDEKQVALVLLMHVLRSINIKGHPLNAVPSGIVSIAKAIYLFGDDPTLGADENVRVLACADKFNFGPVPGSLSFEYQTKPLLVRNRTTGVESWRDFGYWIFRGESKVSANTLLLTLAPETKERKSDRVAWFLIEQLKNGPLAASVLRSAVADLEPPVSWRTVERVKTELGILESNDPKDQRWKIWELPPDLLATLEEVTTPEDEVRLEEIEQPDDTFPEDWTSRDGDGEGS